MDDEELVLQVLRGNMGAYGELVVRFTAQIAALCRAHVPEQEVEDLVQEVFFRGLDKLANLHKPDRFGFWLYGIARNLCLDWHNASYRRDGSLDAVVDPLAVPEPLDEDDRSDRIADLKRCISRLPVAEREVIEIYYSAGRITYAELADRLDVSFGQVNKWLTTARKMLRVCLERKHAITSRSA
jgi:RNA polymerase sigma-70 factor, ECF subfamily